MSSPVRVLVVSIVFAACGDEPCFQDVLHENRAALVACQPGDPCVVPTEDAACACFGSYNARQQELWDSLRSGSRCEDCPHGFCPEQVNPRCEDGKCVTDNAGPLAYLAAPPRDGPTCAAAGARITPR